FGVALSTVVLPNLSSKSAVQNQAQFRSIVQWGIRIALLVSIPAATGLFILSGPLIASIFLGGNFNNHDLYMTQYSLMAYAFGLIGLSLVLILAPAYYAKQNTRTPVKFGLIAMVTNASLSILFVTTLVFISSPYPHMGLSLAFSCSTLLNAVLLFRGLIREQQIKIDRDEVGFFIRVLTASMIMAGMLLFFNPELPIWLEKSLLGRAIHLMKLIPSAILVYLFTLFCIGIRLRDIRIQTNSEPL
ncbi:uncharacterized protein METZ01_LOCUS452795, partial [marine metagenome]